MTKFLDIFRIMAVVAVFFAGYSIGFSETYDPVAQIRFMTPLVIFVVAGISGLEGLLAGKKAAAAKGFTADGNYQRQSALAMVTLPVIAFLVWALRWGTLSELTILFTFLLFFLLSGINHLADAITRKNYAWQNINRLFITLMMVAGFVYPVIMALKAIR
jgi:uncharacterized membrane protein YtjA (UPF0391 family)